MQYHGRILLCFREVSTKLSPRSLIVIFFSHSLQTNFELVPQTATVPLRIFSKSFTNHPSILSFLLLSLSYFCPPIQCRKRGLSLDLIKFSKKGQSVGLPWNRHRPFAETSTWRHATFSTDRYPCPGGIRTRNPNKRAAADPRLRVRQPGSAILSVDALYSEFTDSFFRWINK